MIQIIVVGIANATANFVQMELDVAVFLARQITHELAAEAFPIWATESLAAPDCADRMETRDVLAAQANQSFMQLGLRADGHFDFSGILRFEMLIQKGEQFDVAEKELVNVNLLGIRFRHTQVSLIILGQFYGIHDLRVAFDGEYRGALPQSIASLGGDGQNLTFVRKIQADGECSVFLQFYRMP